MSQRFPRLYKRFTSQYETLSLLKQRIINSRRSKYSLKQMENKLSEIYLERTGKKLDWNHLTSYTEKIQWAKLYDNNLLKSQLSDKYAVRSWVSEKIGDEYLIPLLGVWEEPEDIEFDKMPSRFVLKLNNGSGDIRVIKKNSIKNNNEIVSYFTKEMKKNFPYSGFELHYLDIKPKIIAEKYIEDNSGQLNDYKFMCFHGRVYYCWVDVDRHGDHRRNVYDLNWELQNWNQNTYGNTDKPVQKPKNFDKMVEIATILSQGFSHVRVDLYNVDGIIYFGEMTFTNGSGFALIYPDSANEYLGSLWHLPIDGSENSNN